LCHINFKLDEEFLVRYQLNYGVDPSAQTTSTAAASAAGNPVQTSSHSQGDPQGQNDDDNDKSGPSNPLKRKQPPQPPQWFEMEDSQNTKVYVSNLPTDITEEEFIDVMQKCGLVVKDVQTNQPKIKLYTDSNGKKKGDGLCTYIKIESVQLALQILDGSDLRGNTISVERARFELKGQYDPSKKPKQKKRKDKEKMKKKQESLFAWQPDKLRGTRGKNERVVVVQNAFAPEDFDKDVGLILEYQQDFREEAGKCGKCKKVVIYDRHPEGIMQIYMTSPEEADGVVNLFNNRFFGGKKISAYLWDGETKYKIEETDAQREERLKKWEKFIAEPEPGAGDAATNENNADGIGDAAGETPPATPPYVGEDDEGSD